MCRLLQVEWDENDQPTFAKNEKNNLDCDALVIDELSMVDVLLFENEWSIRLACENNPGLELAETANRL